MRHSTFAGGKRLRPVLAMQAAVTIAGEVPKGIERSAQPSKCSTPIR
jgi:geranylgeranyl diphosphate synthase, type II